MRCSVAFVVSFIAVVLGNSKYEKWSDLEPSFSLSQLHRQKAIVDKVFSPERLELFSNIDSVWKIFKFSFKRVYGSVMEETKRFLIFGSKFIEMVEHNRAYRERKATYEMGVNNFTDRTEYELKKLRGYKSACRLVKRKGPTFISSEDAKLPDRVDWRRDGSVTAVKNQGQCGSCWAFSSTGAIEGQHHRKTKRLVNLSEQQLIDCSKSYGNNGCDGGLMDLAFQYVRDNEGIDSETTYPYISGDGSENAKCLFNSTNIMAQVTDYVNLPEGDERALMNAVATIGPVSIAINAGLPSFSMYKSGIYSDPKCTGSSEDLDHGVLLVGYGIENGTSYWLIKNSWGKDWGDNGYVKILKDSKNMCGVASAASYPLV
ncbi:hypothetical protein MN116_001808 [Schistosoma mekongi]|uniref:Cathepsin L n=1 Tax=Schistosoma mekongi TaxID=38744 RepID=A0AAE1ZIQ7_SCHME|nr:hypothetical protein MN116_001808 [Schistosoma mekongi]